MSDSLFDDELQDEGFDVDEVESDEIGMTSDESPKEDAGDDSADEGDVEETSKKKAKFSVFDAMLLVALICVTAATVILVFELRKFGNFPFSFPWRTSEFLNVLGF